MKTDGVLVMALFYKKNGIKKIYWNKGYTILIPLCLVYLSLVLPVIALAEEGKKNARVAILPFENISGHFLFIDDVMKPLYQNLDDIFTLSSYEEVDDVILRLRLRHTGYLSSQEALEISRRLGVDAVILGMICVYQEHPEPRIGLIMKMIGTGEGAPILWMKSNMISGNQTQTWFGRNRIHKIDALFNKAVKDMVKDIPIDFFKEG